MTTKRYRVNRKFQIDATDLPDSSFPFVLQYIDPDTNAILWGKVIESPDVVPLPLLKRRVQRVAVRIAWPDGKVEEAVLPWEELMIEELPAPTPEQAAKLWAWLPAVPEEGSEE